jgi:cathepsin B
LFETRVVTDDCYPYTSGNGVTGSCLLESSECPSGSGSTKRYHAASAYSVSSNQEDIMQEIYKNGPVEAAYMVYQDFYSYQSGVYEHVSGGLVGGHAVKIIGWGTENNTPYWLVANSWGTSWAEYGGE